MEKIRSKDGTPIAFDRLGGGSPFIVVERMRDEPSWAEMEAMAPTIAYDSEIMGDMSRGGTVPTDLVRAVTIPALVLCGGASPGWMIDTTRQIADAMPNGRLGVLEGEEHVVASELLAPALAEFLVD